MSATNTSGKVVVLAVLMAAIATAVVLRQGRNDSAAVYVAAAEPSPAVASPSTTARVPRLLELGSALCIPCKAMQPVLEELRRTYPGRLQVDFIDVRKQSDIAERYRIDSIPTQIFFDADGRELFRHVGFYSKDDIVARFKALGQLP